MPGRKNNQDFWLIFDLAIAELVGEWAKKNPGAISEAVSKIGVFFQTKKFPRGSSPYMQLLTEGLVISRDVPRAAKIAFQTLADHEIREAGEE